ncbi:MAG: hypothetical protein JO116_24485 [Planctomycetaceae bacterium]|nr:hypothetical protein [Planctomycetaceae bacterium]
MRKVRTKQISVSVYIPKGDLPSIHPDYPWLEVESDDCISLVAKIGAGSVRKLEDHEGAAVLVGKLVLGEDGLEVTNACFNFLGADGATPIRKPRPAPGGPRR